MQADHPRAGPDPRGPADDDPPPPPEGDQEALPFWLALGYTEGEAMAILQWQIDNQQSPGPDAIIDILNNEFIEISDDEKTAMYLLTSLTPEERTQLENVNDFTEEEKNWLISAWDSLDEFMNPFQNADNLVYNVMPLQSIGVGALGLIGSALKLSRFRRVIGKVTGFMKYGVGIGAGIGGATTLASVLGSKLVKSAGAVAGVDGMMVWLASDNVLTGAGFTLRKLRDSIKLNVIQRTEAEQIISDVMGWLNGARTLVEISSSINPFLLPFRDILLVNIDKSFRDVELETGLINDALDKQEAEGGV